MSRKPNFIANNPVGVQDDFDVKGKQVPTNINKNAINGTLQEKLDGLLAAAAKQNDYHKRVSLLQEVLIITRTMTNELKKLSWYYYQYESVTPTLSNLGCCVYTSMKTHDLYTQKTDEYGDGVDLKKSILKLLDR